MSTSERGFSRFAVVLLGVAAALPVFLRYLPMTDLPQHLAVAAIMEHLQEPAFDLERYFALDLHRTLYLLPYALCLAFGKLFGLRVGMHLVVALGSAACLGGLVLILRARQQPAWLALLGLPFLFNRAFFWGFLNFNLGVGLALLAVGLLFREPRSTRAEVLAAACALLSVVTHVYGVVIVLAFMAAWAVFEPRAVLARWRAIGPAVLGVVVWAVLLQKAPGIEGLERPRSPSVGERLVELPDSILGGWADASELLVLVAGLAVAAWFARPKEGPRGWTVFERLLALAVVGNVVLYLVLPAGTESAGFVYFRHAVLAALVLPALARVDAVPERWRRLAPGLVGGLSLLVSAGHLVAFDAEARGFDAVLAQVPMGSRVIYLPLAPHGEVSQTAAYLHFGAYVQAERGGFVAQSFPQLFWNVPVKTRPEAVPRLRPGIEFAPQQFDDAFFGGFFDYALLRVPGDEVIDRSASFPFELAWSQPPWRLYRRVR